MAVLVIGTAASAPVPAAIGGLRDSSDTLGARPAQVSAGGNFSLATRDDGAVFAWGNGKCGQLGNGTEVGERNADSRGIAVGGLGSTTPGRVLNLSDITAVAAGGQHALAVASDGSAWSWGCNRSGALGDGTTTDSSIPLRIPTLSGVAAVAATWEYSLALKSDGTVWGWGTPSLSALTSPLPAQVPISNVAAVAAGQAVAIALRADGTVWSWDYQSANPSQVAITGVTAIASRGGHTLALKTDGTVWAWGQNDQGQLGNGTVSSSTSTPTEVVTASGPALGNVVAIATGDAHSLALLHDGTVWAWGDNLNGQLGLGNSGSGTNRSAAAQISGLVGVTAIAGGSGHSLALTADGSMWGWGLNADGQLGNGTTSDSPVPTHGLWAPGAPANVSASPGDGAALVSWAAPTSVGAGPILAYTVTSSDGQHATVAAPATDAVITGLTAGTGYTFTVNAANQFGTGPGSASSDPIYVAGPPGSPANVVAQPGNMTATLSWTAPGSPGIIQYLVTPYENGQAAPSVPTASADTTFSVPGLVNGASYTFTVAAEDQYGAGRPSATSNAVIPDVRPGQPGTPVASAGNGQATLTWTPPVPNGGTPIQQYLVTAYPSNGTLSLSANTGSNVPTYVLSGLHNGAAYTFTVAAENQAGAGAASPPSNAVTPNGRFAVGTSGSINGFAYGELQITTQGQSGCGPNADAQPQVAVSASGTVLVAAERGLGGGSDVWLAAGGSGGASATGCAPTYVGQPNANSGAGAAGGDVAVAIGSAPASGGIDPIYVASLNRGSVSVAHSVDDGQSFVNVPVQAGLPVDDREWIAAYGASTSLVSFHDASSQIDVLRSDDGGVGYVQVAQPIPVTDYRATANQLGSLIIDHRTAAGVSPGPAGLPGFWTYQAFVAPSTSTLTVKNEIFVATSSDGGFAWNLQTIGCSLNAYGLDNAYPSLSVDPSGNLWAAWADPTNVYTAVSADHGATWTCSGSVSGGLTQALEPTLVATSAGVDLAYYATPTPQETWSVYFVQNLAGTAGGWGTPQQLNTVHSGLVCDTGATCNGNGQLYQGFGIDVDGAGWAHITYSHDAPSATCNADLGCDGTYTGYLVQTSGSQVGIRN